MNNDTKLKNKILLWGTLQDLLAKTKKEEMTMRVEIAEALLEGESVGVHTFDFEGFKLKAAKKVNINLLPDELSNLTSIMTPEEQDCIVYKATLNKKLYNNLDDSSVIDECIVITPATPTISIIRGK